MVGSNQAFRSERFEYKAPEHLRLGGMDHRDIRERFSADTGGLDVIRKETWPFYRTSSGVRLCWELEQPKGPKGLSKKGRGVGLC